MNKLYKVGVTGVICSGKSTLINYLKGKKYQVLNFDDFTNVIYKRNLFSTQFLEKNFPNEIFETRNHIKVLKKQELGKLVFNNDEGMGILNNMMRKEFETLYKDNLNEREQSINLQVDKSSFLIFIEGAIIGDLNYQEIFDEVWLISANDQEIERRFKERIKENKKYSEDFLERILKIQINVKNKLSNSSVLIDSSGSYEETQEQIRKKLYDLEKKLEKKFNYN